MKAEKVDKKTYTIMSFRVEDEYKKRLLKIEEVTGMIFPIADILRNALKIKLEEYENTFDIGIK